MPQMTKTQRIARERLIYHYFLSDRELDFDEEMIRDQVPDAWHTIVEDVDCFEPKEKVTLYLDRSVAKVFRAMGRGYQERINRILGAWVNMRNAGLLDREKYLIKRTLALQEAGEE
ncbi:MAG: BrnA antitoxin family protein [Pseudomonadota bacterium]